MSLIQKIKKVRDALLNLDGIDVYHYWREVKKSRYIIWTEDFESDSFYASNGLQEQQIHGTVHLFTKTEYDPAVDAIQNVLGNACIPFKVSSIQYEDETGFIHYEWEWDVV